MEVIQVNMEVIWVNMEVIWTNMAVIQANIGSDRIKEWLLLQNIRQ